MAIMNSEQKGYLQVLIQSNDFKEARRYIRTLNHPKQVILLKQVDIAEQKRITYVTSHANHMNKINHLIDKGHYEKARRYVDNVDLPNRTDVLLKIEDKRQTDTMKALIIGHKIENEPQHPYDILETHNLKHIGKAMSFLLGLRTLEMLKNYKRMDRSRSYYFWAIVYALKVTIFLGTSTVLAVRAVQGQLTPVELILATIAIVLLALSPYLNALTHIQHYDQWYHDFSAQ